VLNHHLKDNLSKTGRGALLLLWLLLGSVLLFSLANLLVYLFVPTDGTMIWVRQGPIRASRTVDGDAAGLQQDDIILQVSGRTVEAWLTQGWRSWPAIIGRWAEPDPAIKTTIQRDQITQTLSVPLAPRPGGLIRSQYLTHLIVSMAYLIVAMLILRMRGWDATARMAALIMILLALVQQNDILPLLGAEWGLATLWLFLPLRLLTRWFAYGATFHFSLIFPTPKSWLKRLPWLPLAIYSLNPLVSLTIMAGTPGSLHARHSAAYPWSKNIYLVYLVLAVIFLIHAYLTARTPLARTQMKWIAWGVVAAIVPNVLFVDLPILLLGQRLLPVELSDLLLLMLPIAVTVAILRYRLWDISLVVRASLIYGALTLFLGMVYLVLISLFIGFVGLFGAYGWAMGNPAIYFLAALIVVFLFNPARQYSQQAIDRLFYRDKVNYDAILRDLSRAFATSILLDDLVTLLLETLPQRLNLTGAELILEALPEPHTPAYQTLKAGKLVWLYRLNGEAFPYPPPLADLQKFEVWVCAPLLAGEALLGLYGLGRKRSGEFYNAEEINLIETLSRQVGLTLQNAILHAQMADQVRIERDLEIAQQIQLSLLPEKDPSHPDLEIVGYSIPAQSVGGDFYHYFHFNQDHIGVAVGDASGKGVSAALLMAVSVSTLRAQATHIHLCPGQTAHLLSEMNALLQSQTRISKVNVAMLYATLERNSANGSEGGLEFKVSNGGLVSPILRRPGRASELLDACGLPLGIVETPQYYECRFRLLPGDLVVLCSDGIVEAMNTEREMFGFERLLQVIDQTPIHLSATQFIAALRQAVDTFVGAAPQHDDITVVAIKVNDQGST